MRGGGDFADVTLTCEDDQQRAVFVERRVTSPAALHPHGRELRHTSGVVVPLPSSVQVEHLSYNIVVYQFVREL